MILWQKVYGITDCYQYLFWNVVSKKLNRFVEMS